MMLFLFEEKHSRYTPGRQDRTRPPLIPISSYLSHEKETKPVQSSRDLGRGNLSFRQEKNIRRLISESTFSLFELQVCLDSPYSSMIKFSWLLGRLCKAPLYHRNILWIMNHWYKFVFAFSSCFENGSRRRCLRVAWSEHMSIGSEGGYIWGLNTHYRNTRTFFGGETKSERLVLFFRT
jgi:hypothetical protein